MLSRKHYQAVGEILSHFPEGSPTASMSKMAESFADMFARDNPRFDRARFYEACGLGIGGVPW